MRQSKKKPKKNQEVLAKKKHEVFANLPSEITLNIFLRLPVQTVLICKCVSKPWLDLLESDEFVKSHLSEKSIPGLAVNDQTWVQILEFEDKINLDHHELQCIPVTKFEGPYYKALIHGSANGLLFMYDRSSDYSESDVLWILNPTTRESIAIPDGFPTGTQLSTYGFGAVRKTGQHKLVRIVHEYTEDDEPIYFELDDDEEAPSVIFPNTECQVYMPETGSWRRIARKRFAPGGKLGYDTYSFGAFFEGNLHWLVFNRKGCPLISCFDLEDEVFSIFPSPPSLRGIPYLPSLLYKMESRIRLGLVALEDCLCLRDSTSDDEVIIWLMKDYEDKKSWMKAFVIRTSQIPNHVVQGLIKVYDNGLVAWGNSRLFNYSTKTGTAHDIMSFESVDSVDLILYTSSFHSLRSYAKEQIFKHWRRAPRRVPAAFSQGVSLEAN